MAKRKIRSWLMDMDGVIDAHSESAAMIGDRMDTDIVSGLDVGMETILVLTGLTTRADAERHPLSCVEDRRPIADLLPELG